MQVEKNIAFLINQQFPSYFKEYGSELVALTEEYYKFLEKETNQSNYVNRRMFEYRDISSTLQNMLISFQKKYMADLPYKPDSVVILIKNIIDLYRRKGTESGIKTFFAMFYQEQVEIFYPAKYMLKPSNSKWKTGTYLQMFPNNNSFSSASGATYTYNDIIGANITGSASAAKAAVDKVNFVIINNILTPIIYIDDARGTFKKYERILVNLNGEVIAFGKINGSLNDFIVDLGGVRTSGHQVGDIYDIETEYGYGGKAIVSEVSESFTGEITYDIADGGFGYTVEGTRLIVSDQSLILNNAGLTFTLGEYLQDSAGNRGYVVGQNENSVGIKMDAGDSFDILRTITTEDRSPNVTIVPGEVSIKNVSSPGAQFADTGNPEDVKVKELGDVATAELITDDIAPYLAVPLNSANYNSATPMTGTADPVTLATPLDEAFELVEFNLGTILSFSNVLPGSEYQNDVFAIAVDDSYSKFERRDQVIALEIPAAAGSFNIGERITEANTNIVGVVQETNPTDGYIKITPYDYYGFSGENDIVKSNLDSFPIIRVGTDYDSEVHGENAQIDTETEFAIGQIRQVQIYNSGFGYVDDVEAKLVDDEGETVVEGTLVAQTQGKTSGYWSDFTSHINGYVESANGALEYSDRGMKVQDSDYYQEYSYEIKSRLGREQYESLLKENVHLAGTKSFSKFVYQQKAKGNVKQRFIRFFNDQGEGTPLDNPDLDNVTADVFNLKVDSIEISVDDDSTA